VDVLLVLNALALETSPLALWKDKLKFVNYLTLQSVTNDSSIVCSLAINVNFHL